MNTKTVLVVEDDRDLSALFSTILKMASFMVNTVSTGKDAMAFLEQMQVPDVVVLDMHLPDISGREIYSTLENQGYAHRILVCSADIQLVNEYTARGATAVAKPVAMDKLINTVTRLAIGIVA